MTGAVLALMGSVSSGGGGGGGGGGGSDLAVVLTPDPQTFESAGGSFWASVNTAISGGLAPYTADWFLSGLGSENIVYSNLYSATVESTFGEDAEIYCEVTDANGDVATSNTVPITLPA